MESQAIPNSLYLECPICERETLHSVLKGRTGQKPSLTFDCTVRCEECSFVHQSLIQMEKPMTLPIVISVENVSTPSSLETFPDEEFAVGDEFYLGNTNYKVTGIELAERRVEHALANEVSTLWVKEFDWVKLKISVHRGSRTYSHELRARPEEEFAIGDILFLRGLKVAIHRIKTEAGPIKHGGAQARDIIRLYGRVIR